MILPLFEWSVYIIQSSSDGSLYTGISKNVEKRVHSHNSGKGAKRTKGRGPWIIVFVKNNLTQSSALTEEMRIKKLSRKDKLKLICS